LLDCDFDTINFDSITDDNLKNDNDVEVVISSIFNSHFGSWAANKLSAWSHMDGSPWAETTSKIGFKWGDRIDTESIKYFFKNEVLRSER